VRAPKLNKSRFALLLLVLAFGGLAYGYRQELVKAPRVRVGPLVSAAPAGARLTFFALGDTGTGGEAQLKVAAAMEARCKARREADPSAAPLDGILLLGDNAYQAGVESVDDPQWQTKVLGPYGGECLDDVRIYAVLGNHDYKGNPAAQVEYTLLNKRWFMPNRFYAVTFGSLVKLVAYDSQISEFCFRPQYCSVDFLLEQVAKREATWTLAMGHHPLQSSSDHGHGHVGGLRGILLKPRLCGRADVYIAGHAHHMEHLSDPECGLEMMVSGGGGADLYGIDEPHEHTTFAKSVHGFAELEITESALVGRYFGDDGALLHEFKKAPPRPR